MRRLPFFYGWIIVAVVFVSMGIGVSARMIMSTSPIVRSARPPARRQYVLVLRRLQPRLFFQPALARLLEVLEKRNLVAESPLSIDLASNLPGMDIAVLGHENLKARYFRS